MRTTKNIRWRHPNELREIANQLEADGLQGTAGDYLLAAAEMEARKPFLYDLLFTAWKGARSVEVKAALNDRDVYGRGAEIASFLMAQGWTPPRVLAEPALPTKAREDNR